MQRHYHVYFGEPEGRVDQLRTRKDCIFNNRAHAHAWAQKQRGRGRFIVRSCDGGDWCPFPGGEPGPGARLEPGQRQPLPGPRRRGKRPSALARSVLRKVKQLDRDSLAALEAWLARRIEAAT